MAGKMGAFIIDTIQAGQGKNLIPPAVCEYGMIPRHESMQAANFFDDVHTRTDHEVVCVGQNDLSPHGFKLLRQYALDSPSRTNGHKHRGINDPVGRGQLATPGMTIGVSIQYLKNTLTHWAL